MRTAWAVRLSLAVLSSASVAAFAAMPSGKAETAVSPDTVAMKPAARPATKPTTAPTTKPVSAGIPFEKEILAFEAADRTAPPVGGGIVFYGSSSIRLWRTLKDDFPGMTCVNRGFGGSTIPDALRYAERVLLPQKPKTIVFYSGDNDLQKGRTPEQILADLKALQAVVHEKLPQTKLVLVSVKPSPSRLKLLPQQKAVNQMIGAWVGALKDPNVQFVDVFSAMLTADGTPRIDLFGPDKLHMNRDGYKLWTGLVAKPAGIEAIATAVGEAARGTAAAAKEAAKN
ncbi:MAG TPA: SGNH/GDSL hydrolase family protein [Humisphaera sp.]